jgi:pilus assembly protein CpaE
MPTMSGTRSLNVTILTVCVDPVIVGHALDIAEARNWAVREAAFEGYISARRRPHFGDHLKSGDGCVAIIDFDKDPKQAVEATAYLQQVFAGKIVLVALSSENHPQLMLIAMRAGCTEFLLKESDDRAFSEAFRHVEEQFATRATMHSAAGSIISFFGAKGGVGATTLAVHLACYLVQNNHKRVLLIDNHALFGHVCIYLGLDGNGFHFQDLVRNVNRLDSELLHGFIAKHESGLDVLSSPDSGQNARPMHADDVAATLEFLRSEYDFVIVDCASALDDVNRAAITASSQVYVAATPEISAVRDLSRYVDDLLQVDDTTNKVRVILNRYSSQFAVSLEHIEKAIRLPVSFCIPNAYVELVRSANLGVPVSPTHKSGFTTELTTWANSLVGVTTPVEAPAEKTAGVLAKIKGQLNGLLHPRVASAGKRA